MSNDKDRVALQKITERIARTMEYCASCSSYDDFERNIMLQEACVFNMLQIGELSKRALSGTLTETHADIPWKQMYGLRNHIVHGYEGVMLNIVWDTIREDFPSLLAQLQAILENRV